ncbi:hypothetical protein [Polaribacter sp.]|uniref:hypothetical protein n=1 Tax=Polaribacter sp. TaxID=1920175 RepID=UPI0025E26F04|nr:hypothetical protein [Polaribacter sp.]
MKEKNLSIGAGLGLLAGIIIGSITENIGLWIALGLSIRADIGGVFDQEKPNNN